jgi:hypothetical protein
MVNAGVTSTLITGLLALIVTALCCFCFYIFRMSTSRDQSFNESMKVIRAATEIVAMIAEKGMPNIRGRVEELESRGRTLEQYQRKTGSVVESLARVVGGAMPAGTVTATGPVEDEAAMLAARRAARATA